MQAKISSLVGILRDKVELKGTCLGMPFKASFFAVLKKFSILPQLIAYRHIYDEDTPQLQDICAFSATTKWQILTAAPEQQTYYFICFSTLWKTLLTVYVGEDLWQKKALFSEGKKRCLWSVFSTSDKQKCILNYPLMKSAAPSLSKLWLFLLKKRGKYLFSLELKPW